MLLSSVGVPNAAALRGRLSWLLLLLLVAQLMASDCIVQSGLDDELTALRARVSDGSRAAPIPTRDEAVLVLNAHLGHAVPGLAPESLFVAAARGLDAVAAAVALVRHLLASPSEVRWWFAAAVLALMPAGLRGPVISASAAAATVSRSVLALVFGRTLSLPAGVYVPLYERLLRGIQPPADALYAFFDDVVLPACHDRPYPPPDAFLDRHCVWAQLLERAPAVAVRNLVRRQSTVLAPATWAWVFYPAVVRAAADRERRTKRGAASATAPVTIWDRLVLDLVAVADRAPYDRALLIQFAALAPFSAEQLVATLGRRRFPFGNFCYRPFRRELTAFVAVRFNQLFESQVITRSEVVYGLRGHSLRFLLLGLVLGYRPHLSWDWPFLPADLIELHGELHYAALRCPGGIMPYLELADADLQWISVILGQWLADQDRLESLIRALNAPSDLAWRQFLYLLRIRTRTSPHSPLWAVTSQIHMRINPTEFLVRTIRDAMTAPMLDVMKLIDHISAQPEERLDWKRLFDALLASPYVTTRLSERAVDPGLAQLLRVTFWRQTLDQQRQAALGPDLTDILLPNWLIPDPQVDPASLEKDQVCPVCQEDLAGEGAPTPSDSDQVQGDSQRPLLQSLLQLRCRHILHQRCAAAMVSFKITSDLSRCLLCKMLVVSL